jgi:hypothetical protein
VRSTKERCDGCDGCGCGLTPASFRRENLRGRDTMGHSCNATENWMKPSRRRSGVLRVTSRSSAFVMLRWWCGGLRLTSAMGLLPFYALRTEAIFMRCRLSQSLKEFTVCEWCFYAYSASAGPKLVTGRPVSWIFYQRIKWVTEVETRCWTL